MTKVRVTRKHILNGDRGSPNNCPIALAIKEKYPHLDNILVRPTNITLRYTINGPYIHVPPKGTRFINRFDRFYKIYRLFAIPFTLYLNLEVFDRKRESDG